MIYSSKTDVNLIKEKADSLIGTQVSFPLIKEGNIITISLTLKENKIVENKNICLSFFVDSTMVVNTLTILNPQLYEIITEEKKEEIVDNS